MDLDKILDSGVSFVASSIGSKNINKGCLYLWNGFIAAEKKNPVIGLAIALKVEALKAPTRNSPWIPRLWDVSRTQCGQHETFRPTCWSGIQAESKHLSESEMFDSFVLGHAFEAMAYDTFNEIKLHGDRIFTPGNQMTNAFAMILLVSMSRGGNCSFGQQSLSTNELAHFCESSPDEFQRCRCHSPYRSREQRVDWINRLTWHFYGMESPQVLVCIIWRISLFQRNCFIPKELAQCDILIY